MNSEDNLQMIAFNCRDCREEANSLASRCHPEAPFSATFSHGLLALSCSVCDTPVAYADVERLTAAAGPLPSMH